MSMDFLPELEWRGLLKDITDRDGLGKHLAQPRRIYCGFDPTADSLTIGNLVPIMVLAHAQRAGHTPVVVMGGGTGLIGDPSGKSAERQFLSESDVARNVDAQRQIFQSLLELKPGKSNAAIILNNLDWLDTRSYLDVLRNVGKHFSVNMMMQKDSIRARLEDREHGISYTEFSYMILQAMDFLELNRKRDVSVQCGGSDQWGNIVAGIDLIKRRSWAEYEQSGLVENRLPGREQREQVMDRIQLKSVFAFTAPLVTKADGTKFGKTESGAIWLTADRTSPYAYYQFWLNTTDADVGRYLRIFTFLPREEIEAIEQAHDANPGAREAQRRLAREATTLLHGRDHMETAEHAAKALFSGDITGLDEATLREVFAEVESSDHPKSDLEGEGGAGLDLVKALTACGLAKSNREAREFLGAGSITVNGRKVGPSDRLTTAHLLHGSMIALRRGKKTWRLTRWH